VLLEQHLVRERGWQEFSVYPLFSPQSLIAEGTANFGIEVTFPPADRMTFEREVLFPRPVSTRRRRRLYESRARRSSVRWQRSGAPVPRRETALPLPRRAETYAESARARRARGSIDQYGVRHQLQPW
jgi:hypothetical protein